MKQFNGFDDAKKAAAYQGGERLPEGGYVCKILATKYSAPTESASGQIRLQIDIAEGEYKDFFKKQFDGNTSEDKKWKGVATVWEPKDDGSEKDGWTKTAFARWTNALEESNKGYTWDWDETKWKGKTVGVVFGPTGTVIEGREVVYTEAHYPTSVDNIRSGNFKLSKLKKKNGFTGATLAAGSSGSSDDFVTPPSGSSDEEIPF